MNLARYNINSENILFPGDFDNADSFYIEKLENGIKTSMYSCKPVKALRQLDELEDKRHLFVGYFGYDYVGKIYNINLKKSDFKDFDFLAFDRINVKRSAELDFSIDDYYISSVHLPDKSEYENNVKIAKKFIKNGEIFQVVLSHRIGFKLQGSKFSFFLKMKEKSNGTYNFYYRSGDLAIFGTSPEILIRIKGNKLITNPIAGTSDPKDSKFLKSDEKELAEHNMLVDLARNDLGRVSRIGSVRVKNYKMVKIFKSISHLVSEVVSEKRENVKNIDVFNSVFPAGTVTGAPKLRAMEIINILEKDPRGPYAGSFGIIRKDDWDMNIIIRSVICKGDDCYIQAGAGIVYDSKPLKEYSETMKKIRMAVGGLLV